MPQTSEQSVRRPSEASEGRRRRRRQKDRIAELESTVERQAAELHHLLQHLRRVKPPRVRMSATRSVWIAGKCGFKCQGDRSVCPCWLLREGTFGPEGWQIDHMERWSKGYDDRESNLRPMCPTCHFRVTKEAILRDEEECEGEA